MKSCMHVDVRPSTVPDEYRTENLGIYCVVGRDRTNVQACFTAWQVCDVLLLLLLNGRSVR